MAKHLEIGGSTVSRTIGCPAWVKRAKTVPVRKAGKAADLGNLLHDAMENLYKHDKSFDQQIAEGLTFNDEVLSDDHLPILNQMLTATEKVLDKYDAFDILCEPFVQLIPDKAGGSIDMLTISEDGKTAIILDYKTGAGAVRAKENKQLLFYTLSAKKDKHTAHLFKDVEKYVAAIVQPKLNGSEPDCWEFTDLQLDKFADSVGRAIEQADDENPKAAPGSHCTFCPYAPFCKEKRAQADAALLLPLSKQNELDKAVAVALDVKKWAEEVIATATQYAQDGIQLKSHKLVHGKANRKWSDSKQAESFLTESLESAAFKQTLITPAQAVKAFKQQGLDTEQLNSLIVMPEGKLTLVANDDPREPAQIKSSGENLKLKLDKILGK